MLPITPPNGIWPPSSRLPLSLPSPGYSGLRPQFSSPEEASGLSSKPGVNINSVTSGQKPLGSAILSFYKARAVGRAEVPELFFKAGKISTRCKTLTKNIIPE